MTTIIPQVAIDACLASPGKIVQVQEPNKPASKTNYICMQADIVQIKTAKQGVIPTLKSTGAGAIAGMLAGSVVSVVPMLASTDNMSGLYVMTGAAAGMIGGALAGGMHGSSLDAKASAASAAIIGSVLGGTIGLFSGGIKGALVGGAMAASIGASGAFAGSAVNQ